MPAATFPRLPQGRHGALALTLLVHAALLVAWQGARRAPAAPPDGMRQAIQWIALPALPAARPAVPAPASAARRRAPVVSVPVSAAASGPASAPISGPRPAPPRATPPAPSITPAPASAASATPAAMPAPPADGVPASPAASPAAAPLSATPAPTLLERARQAAGAADRAVRKENNAYIVAPPDSPQLRMRRSMEAAAAMAPNGLFEAPKSEELVNNTGDGARRTRVVTGNGTYCVTERSPATSIDMIEKHGKQRFTNCPAHEAPANAQAWRTARD